jgi:hypothetical protein
MIDINYNLYTFDTRDLVDRYVELRGEEELTATERDELASLDHLLKEVREYAGDLPEDGVTLVRDDYFVEYVRILISDWCGEIPPNFPSYIKIDWEETAKNLRGDYTSVEFLGNTYWYR